MPAMTTGKKTQQYSINRGQIHVSPINRPTKFALTGVRYTFPQSIDLQNLGSE